jgi:hypothetical protein
MFPQCAPANLETSCLLEIGDFSQKLRLRCSCQFPWCALPLMHTAAQQIARFFLTRVSTFPADKKTASKLFRQGHG